MRSDRDRRRKESAESIGTFSSTNSHSRRHDRHRQQSRDEEYVSDRRRFRQERKSSRNDDDNDDDEYERRREERKQRRRDRRDRRDRRERRADREHRGHNNSRRGEDRSGTYDEKIENPFESPPPYDEKPRNTRDRPNPKRTASNNHEDEEQGTQLTSTRHLSRLERIGGPFIYIIPLLTAFCLLAASTCSADWWRKDVSVIRLGLPGDVYARLLATGNNLGKGGGEAVVEISGKLKARAAKISPQGWLSVGFWGWCVAPEVDGPWACSETDAWYTMDELLETAAVTSTIPTDAYFVGLMHGIMFHGLATMAATVPAGILIWRRYIRNDKTIGPGLALHATMFAGSAFSFIAFIIDKALQARLAGQTKYPVEQGSVPIMTGVSALLLFLSFLTSITPGIRRRVKRQQEYAGSWEDVHAASELKRSLSVGTTATGLTRSKTWMKRMTRLGGRGRY